ncbi:hypothetical protein FRB94_006399 [Tulasnella sp. JGI-2019a]|nr:hypothetical protein FRB94_006399 [Tulasnella sp. JGI-2019a]KAG9005062.1 hypothetical protein FRB93_009931 [Tulasnella sp. JGI-2019a]
MRITNSVAFLSATTLVGAWDFSFFGRAVNAAQKTFGLKAPTVKIAVIGAGAGGSSAAYWVSKAQERHGLDVEVDVFEKDSRIGGRTTVVYPYYDEANPGQELGASIFVAANKNLWRATTEFNLTFVDLQDEDDDFGLWDGQQFAVTYRGSLLDKARMLWRYGLAPMTTTKIVTQMIDKLLLAYTRQVPIWPTIEALSNAIGLANHTTVTALEFFTSHGVGEKWIKEMIDAATRVNYAQDSTAISGLGGAVSMAATGASQVQGGNFQIFEKFLEHSNAKVHLDRTITRLTKTIVSGKTKWIPSGSDPLAEPVAYDHIILAAPLHLSGIDVISDTFFPSSLPKVDYVHLHVTMVSSTSFRPLASKFGVNTEAEVPRFILTTGDSARNGGPKPEFQSISYYKTYEVNGRTEHLFKIFSLEERSDEWLEETFGEGTIGWVHRKEWDSYPKLVPRSVFPSIKADAGLWYVNSMEAWISTMETEVLSARNVVDNMLMEAFGKGICPPAVKSDKPKSVKDQEEIYGWDC